MKKKDFEKQILKLYYDGVHIQEIADQFQLSKRKIYSRLGEARKKMGLPLRSCKIKRPSRRIEKMNNTDKIKTLYRKGFSRDEIAQKTGLALSTIGWRIQELKKRGLLKQRKYHKQKSGERHNRAKLTEKEVRQIIMKRLDGISYKEIAGKFGVHHDTIKCICIGKTWKYIFTEYKEKIEYFEEKITKNQKK